VQLLVERGRGGGGRVAGFPCHRQGLLYEHMFEEETLSIECEACVMRHSDHCRDCIVSVLVEPSPRRGALVVDADEERALRELAASGLIPEIRMRRKRTA
jgi:hypothetical protein